MRVVSVCSIEISGSICCGCWLDNWRVIRTGWGLNNWRVVADRSRLFLRLGMDWFGDFFNTFVWRSEKSFSTDTAEISIVTPVAIVNITSHTFSCPWSSETIHAVFTPVRVAWTANTFWIMNFASKSWSEYWDIKFKASVWDIFPSSNQPSTRETQSWQDL